MHARQKKLGFMVLWWSVSGKVNSGEFWLFLEPWPFLFSPGAESGLIQDTVSPGAESGLIQDTVSPGAESGRIQDTISPGAESGPSNRRSYSKIETHEK